MKNQTKKPNKKITISDLAMMMEQRFTNLDEKMDKGFKRTYRKIDKEIDTLALMVGKGFNKMDERFDGIDSKLGKVEEGVQNVKADLNKKVSIFMHNDLKFRVEKVEEKVGILKKR